MHTCHRGKQGSVEAIAGSTPSKLPLVDEDNMKVSDMHMAHVLCLCVWCDYQVIVYTVYIIPR